jgi:hypothetical protein
MDQTEPAAPSWPSLSLLNAYWIPPFTCVSRPGHEIERERVVEHEVHEVIDALARQRLRRVDAFDLA